MNKEQLLMQQIYQLKNQITDLKNAFDLNRDILKILSTYNSFSDPQLHLLMQIILRLTNINNQVMISNLELIQQKNTLHHDIIKLHEQIAKTEQKLNQQIKTNSLNYLTTQSKLLIKEQLDSLNCQIMVSNEERIYQQQQLLYWKQKYQKLLHKHNKQQFKEQEQFRDYEPISKIKRKYKSNANLKYEVLFRQQEKQNKRLKQYIEQLENRLLVFIKAYNLHENLQPQNSRRQKVEHDEYQATRQEIRLLKYGLNGLQIQKKNDEYILTITQRFRQNETTKHSDIKDRRTKSWPKTQETTFLNSPKQKEAQNNEILM